MTDGLHNCYEAALELVLTHPEYTLVHGVPTGGGGDIVGVRYGHAWAEHGDVVHDHSNGKQLAVRRELYYRAGNIDPAECYRYTAHEARMLARHTGHGGPWQEHHPDVQYSDEEAEPA